MNQPKSAITIIYHRADYDGIFCYQIAKQFFSMTDTEVEYIGWDYGDPVPNVPPNETKLYMLDISVDGLMDHPRLNWVDHHKSAIDKYPATIPGYRIDGVAACRLTWQYFALGEVGGPVSVATKEDFLERRVGEPLAVRLAGEYDIWDKRDPRAELFQHGLRSRDLSEADWEQILSPNKIPTIAELEALIDAGFQGALEPDGTCPPSVVLGLLSNGKVLQYAKDQENAGIIKSYGFTIQFDGLRFLACNHARFNPHLFTAGLTDQHDACLGFNWDGEKWRVSLYHAPGKEHHDLSIIAMAHGGGGHRGACGFRAEKLPFLP